MRKEVLNNGNTMAQPPSQNFNKIEKLPIKKKALDELACKIVISCSSPSSEGKMDVEMTYEGDPTLAMFLLDNAREYFENQIDE